MKKIIVAIIIISISFFYLNAEINVGILIQEAIHKEEILGDINSAIEIYNKILNSNEIDNKLRAKITLRKAFCYERIGKLEKAEILYREIIKKYSKSHEIIRIAKDRIKEHLRKKEINEIKKQNKELQKLKKSSSKEVRERLESKIIELENRIKELESKKPNKNGNKTKKLKNDNQDIRASISLHLFNIGKNLYKKGFLISARENLKKSLSFNEKNKDAERLLSKVESLIKKIKDKKNQEKTEYNEIVPEIFQEIINEGNEKTNTVEYDLSRLYKNFEISEDKNITKKLLPLLSNYLLRKNWNLPEVIQYKEKKLTIRQNSLMHKKIADFLEKLPDRKEILKVDFKIIGILNKGIDDFFQNLDIKFSPLNHCIFYSLIPENIYEKLKSDNFLVKDIKNSSSIFILKKEEKNWQNIKKIPFIDGYKKGGVIRFKWFTEGIKIKLYYDKNIYFHFLSSKRIASQNTIPTQQGHIEIPYFLTQKSDLELDIEKEKHFLLGGIYQNNNFCKLSEHYTFFLYVKIKKFPLKSYFLDDTGVENSYISDNKKLEKYNIKDIIKNIKDFHFDYKFDPNIENTEERKKFLKLFLKKKLKEVDIKLIKDFVFLNAEQEKQEELKSLIDGIRNNKKLLFHFFGYICLINKQILEEIIIKSGMSLVCESPCRVYHFADKSFDINQYFDKYKIIKILPNLMAGNTQEIGYINLSLESFTENIKENKGFFQSHTVNIPQGISIHFRPIVYSEETGDLQIKIKIFEKKEKRDYFYALKDKQKISLSIPELYIKTNNIDIPFNKKGIYLIRDFQAEQGEEQFILLIFSNITKELPSLKKNNIGD